MPFVRILILEPFFTGSHQKWAEGLQKYSRHEVRILSLPGRHWKWRMHGGAVTLAKKYLESSFQADLVLGTSMLDLTTFLALTRRKKKDVKTAYYFHENQITYPWSTKDQDPKKGQDRHYGWIQFTSALAADAVYFNSSFHQQSFLTSLPRFLKAFPDYKELESVDDIRSKSTVLSLGMDLSAFDIYEEKKGKGPARILWNHRWEFDKNPEAFFQSIAQIKKEKLPFKLLILGQQFPQSPTIFKQAKERFSEHIEHWGYCSSFAEYAQLLWRTDISLTTSIQDFFGGSVVEALYTNNHPILPNRLAYPAHIPNIFHEDTLYNDNTDLLNKLRKAIEQVEQIRQNHQSKDWVKKYDWSVSCPKYDEAFEKI